MRMSKKKLATGNSGPTKADEGLRFRNTLGSGTGEAMSAKPLAGAARVGLMLIVVAAIAGGGPGMTWSAGAAADNQMMAAARSYVEAHSVPGITFELKLLKQVDNYALLEATPQGKWANQAEPAGVILQKIGGTWVPQAMGTDLSTWESRVPELFP